MMSETMRYRLSMICTGMLYLGAVVAGLTGQGWGAVATFAVVFALWLTAIEPGLGRALITGQLSRPALMQTGLRVAAQTAIVTICFGLGRGIAGIAGSLPAIPLILPLGLSFAAVPAVRALQTRGTATAATGAEHT